MPSDYPGIRFDDEGVCGYCLETQRHAFLPDEKMKQKINRKDRCKIEFENTLETSKGKAEYDCLLSFSGGKDSVYLAYLLTKKYRQKVLSFTLENWIQRPGVKDDIMRAISKLNIDHIFITPRQDFFKTFYRNLLFSDQKDDIEKRSYYGICPICSKMILGMSLKEAAKRNIPLVIVGYSPDQTFQGFYEIPPHEIKLSWAPQWLYSRTDFEKYKKYFWDSDLDNKSGLPPRVLFPLHVLKYPSPDEIRRDMVERGFIKKKNPILRDTRSDCLLVSLFHYLMKKKGYDHATLSSVSHRIRIGVYDREKTLILLKLSKLLFKSGIYRHFIRRKDINYILKFLDLKMTELL